jgi:hypothetical protein
MNGTRVALIGMVAACALAAWPRRQVVVDTHWSTRQFVIQSTVARFDDAIIVVGDSIVEASTLPRTLCGHPIINAGIGGASTASGLSSVLSQSLAGRQAALIVVSLGTNDAAIPNSVAKYRSNYLQLLTALAALTRRSAIAAIPPPEAGLEEAKKVSNAVINSYNAILPGLAEEAGSVFIPLSAMPERHTLDGIHLNAAGYEIWDKSLSEGIKAALCKSG